MVDLGIFWDFPKLFPQSRHPLSYLVVECLSTVTSRLVRLDKA